MADNEQVIRDFIAAWSRLDVEELVQYFCEDGTYYNMPTQPVTGHAALRPFISAFLKGWTSTEWDVLNLISKGDIVFAERLDRTLVGTKPAHVERQSHHAILDARGAGAAIGQGGQAGGKIGNIGHGDAL